MAILASDVLTRVRDQHPLFHRSRVTDAVLLRSLSTYEGQLLSRALLRDRTYLVQQASIIFSTQSASGAGVGGFPASVANDGTVSRERQPTGYAKELDLNEGTILVGEFVPSATTALSLTKASAGWTVNQYIGAYVNVTAGTGVDERRLIVSNTVDTLVWTTALAVPLDTTSVVEVISAASSVDEDVGVVTALPATDSRLGYLVKLDATGTAYIDLTDPLTAVFDRGIPLPPFKHVVGGTIRFSGGLDTCELTLGSYGARTDTFGDYSAYISNRQLFLIGDSTDWSEVASIDLRYVPNPPALAALTDYFLLPDHAEPALIAQGAFIAAQRVQGLEGMAAPDLALLAQERSRAEQDYLSEVAASMRGTSQRLREDW